MLGIWLLREEGSSRRSAPTLRPWAGASPARACNLSSALSEERTQQSEPLPCLFIEMEEETLDTTFVVCSCPFQMFRNIELFPEQKQIC